jgi:hypothetical protein
MSGRAGRNEMWRDWDANREQPKDTPRREEQQQEEKK